MTTEMSSTEEIIGRAEIDDFEFRGSGCSPFRLALLLRES